MNIDILTLFPDSVDAMLNVSILGRAQERGYIAIRTHQIREYTTNKQMQVDDYPYGGGRGAVMQADPLYRCWAHVCGGGPRAGADHLPLPLRADLYPRSGPGAEGDVQSPDSGLRALRGGGPAVFGRVRG